MVIVTKRIKPVTIDTSIAAWVKELEELESKNDASESSIIKNREQQDVVDTKWHS